MQDTPIAGYRFLVTNPERLGGKVTIRGTRFAASFILACLAEGMSYEDIVREYSEFPRESIPEVLHFAAELTGQRYGCAERDPFMSLRRRAHFQTCAGYRLGPRLRHE